MTYFHYVKQKRSNVIKKFFVFFRRETDLTPQMPKHSIETKNFNDISTFGYVVQLLLLLLENCELTFFFSEKY